MNYKQWTESPGNLWQRIKRISPKNWKVLGCKNSIKSEENGLVWYIKNNIETLLVAVRTSRTVTHKETETVDPKEFKKTREEQKKKRMDCKKNAWIICYTYGGLSSTILTKLPSHPFLGSVVQ